jgi:hypothetical protein
MSYDQKTLDSALSFASAQARSTSRIRLTLGQIKNDLITHFNLDADTASVIARKAFVG